MTRLNSLVNFTIIQDTIEANTVTIITGATGCGKTTMIPQFILNYHKVNRYLKL